MFKVIGKIFDEEESLTYDVVDGVSTVTGSKMAMCNFEFASSISLPTGPVGMILTRDIQNPLAALFMMMECFEEVVSVEGDAPVADDVPDGAVC